ncbi:hypothetical protein C0J52_17909, partial [Blattella germanica]
VDYDGYLLKEELVDLSPSFFQGDHELEKLCRTITEGLVEEMNEIVKRSMEEEKSECNPSFKLYIHTLLVHITRVDDDGYLMKEELVEFSPLLYEGDPKLQKLSRFFTEETVESINKKAKRKLSVQICKTVDAVSYNFNVAVCKSRYLVIINQFLFKLGVQRFQVSLYSHEM